jgi:hypothetical protein
MNKTYLSLNATYLILIQVKLKSITLAYNGGFQNEMYHILGILKLEFTIFDPLLHLC